MPGFDVTEAVSAADLARYDAVIDVRSPAEFALDHLPGAENLPVLDDQQRAQVGTIYVQESRFLARRIGAAHVARNIALHLETALADRPASFRPLIYCWRGGQRSEAMATILSQVGWPVTLLRGGYRTYRRLVTARLYDTPQDLKLLLIDGHTGSAKTEVLHELARLGAQIIDLEGLAAHRGSLFGALAGRPQPSQKLFESQLLQVLDGLDLTRPIVVEAEASKIGDRLPVAPSQERREAWRAMIAAGAFADLAQALIDLHYDPAYDRAAKKADAPVLTRLAIEPADPNSRAAAARAIAGAVQVRYGGL